ncbi:MAG: hypothetical protein AB8G86_26600 [Saprospiraceae bacterium]
MNLTKAKILLDKINRLYKSMSLDEENVATIEKDLMRDYVKQLYDAFLQEEATTSVPVRQKKAAPRPTYTPPPAYTPPAPVVRKKIETVTPPPPPPPVVEEVTAYVARTPPPRIVIPPTPKVVTTPPPPPPVVVESTPVSVVPPQPRRVTPTTVVDPEHADLFEVSTSTKELSEKLGQTRINDLNNAMGLNERIFTVNELFGADNSLYRNVIRDLNNLNSYEEAKAYLSTNVAEKFNWTHKSKRNKAKNFIKIVRRRYS